MKKNIILFLFILSITINLFSVYHKVGELSTSTDYCAIAINENLLFVNDEEIGVMIYEISNPVTPVHISTINIIAPISFAFFQNSLVYLLDYDGKMYVVNIADIYSPQILSEYNTIESARKMFISENLAYIIEYDYYYDLLEVVDVSSPSDPQYVSDFELTGSGTSCFAVDSLAVIGTMSGLFIYDISNPYNITEINWLDTGYARSVIKQDEFLFFRGNDGLTVVDFSDPLNLQIISTNDDIFYNNSYVEGNMLYGVSNRLINVVDISDPHSTNLIGSYIPYDFCNTVAVKNGYAYINSWLGGVNIIDLSNPENEFLISFQDLESDMIEKTPNSEYLAIYGDSYEGLHFYEMSDILNPDYLYSHISNGGTSGCSTFYMDDDVICSVFGYNLYIYDLSDPIHLHIPGIVSLNNTWARSIARKDDLIYVGTGDHEIKIFDISDINNPTNVCNVDVGTWIFDLTINEDNLYFVDINGLRIFDISDPLDPVEVGFWDSNNRAEQCAVYCNYVYVVDYDGGVKVIDVSEPTNPQLIYTIILHSSSRLDTDPIIRDQKLFISDRVWNEIAVYDLVDPAHPNHLFSFNWDHFSNDLEVFENYIYSANGDDQYNHGLSLLDFSNLFTSIEGNNIQNPSSEFSLSNYPNPFNPSTTIQFSLKNDTKIDLAIFNIKGQKIKALANNEFTEGNHSIIWNGDDEFGKNVSSGIYYYKLNVKGKTEVVKKCLLLK